MGDTERLVRGVEDARRRGLDAKGLREAVVARLRAAIDFDGYVFALTDPVTRIATSPLADVPMVPWPQLPELIRWRYVTLVNRPDRLLGEGATSLHGATGGDLSLSPMWQHVQRDLGVVDTATVVLDDRHGAWGFLELWRTSEPFDVAHLDALTAMRPAVTIGLREALARTFEHETARAAPGPAVVVLDSDLQVRSQTDAASAALLALNPPDEPMAPIPAAAYNVGAALLAVEEGVPIGEPWSRVHLGVSRWVTLRASRLGPDIAVTIEPSTPTERVDLASRIFGLSRRESEVLGLLATGLDTRTIAARLVVSEHTVNDHVKAVLGKAGAHSRQALVARVVGA